MSMAWLSSHREVLIEPCPQRCSEETPNARGEPPPEADARDERTLEAVGCRRLFGLAHASFVPPPVYSACLFDHLVREN
jgi:hypothetical protein